MKAKNMRKLLATAVVMTLAAAPTLALADETTTTTTEPAATTPATEPATTTSDTTATETVSTGLVTMTSARVLQPNQPIVVTATEDVTLYVNDSLYFDYSDSGMQPTVDNLDMFSQYGMGKKVMLTANTPTTIDVPELAQYAMDMNAKVVLFAVNGAGQVSIVDSVSFAQDYQPTPVTLRNTANTLGYPIYTGYSDWAAPKQYLVPASATVTDVASLEALVASGDAVKQTVNVHREGIIPTTGLSARDYVIYAVSPFGTIVKGSQTLTFDKGTPAPLLSDIVATATGVTVSGVNPWDLVEVYDDADLRYARLLTSGTVQPGAGSITLPFTEPKDSGYVYVRVTQSGKAPSVFTEIKYGDQPYYGFNPELSIDADNNWLQAGTPISVQSNVATTIHLVPNVGEFGFLDTQVAIANAVRTVNVQPFERVTFDTTGLNSLDGYVFLPVSQAGMDGVPSKVYRFKN